MAVQARGRLRDAERTPFPDGGQKRLIQTGGLVGTQADVNRDPLRAQRGKAAAADLRKRVFHRGNDTADAGGDDAIGAGTRSSEVHAGLEGAVERGAARCLSGFVEGVHFSVRFACTLMGALPNHNPFARNDAGTDDGIRCGSAKTTARVVERALHPPQARRYHFSWNSASTYSCGENGIRSSMPSPTPTYLIGSFRSGAMAAATPPLAVPSSLVSTMPVTPATLVNSRACCTPFWPTVASRTSSTSCGAPSAARPATRRIFSSS